VDHAPGGEPLYSVGALQVGSKRLPGTSAGVTIERGVSAGEPLHALLVM
jgi:hypothetical protein